MLSAGARVASLLSAALLVAACSGGGSSGAAADGTVEIVAGVAATGSSAALHIGLEQGFFAEERIDLEIGKAATGAAAITQVINGQQQVALGGISPVVTAVASNIPVVLVSGAVTDRESPEGTIHETIVRADSGIQSFADLAGKTVAVNSLKCCWEFWIREAVAKSGADPNSLNLVQLPFPDQVTALRQGTVDAISTIQPYATELRQDGFRNIGDSPAVAFDNPDNANTLFYMARSFVEEHPDIVERWRRALQKSSDYANEHPDETRAKIVQQTGVDPELIKAAPLPHYTAEIDVDSVAKEAQFAVKYGVIPQAPDISALVVQVPAQ
jgi:NitT/TauT family transport system substrate-binding protein